MSRNIICPCGDSKAGQASKYSECCEPYINGSIKPDHCEQLMRSRYTAYSLAKIDYLIATWHPSKQSTLNRQDLIESAATTGWLRLQIIKSSQNGEDGTVEFNAWYRDQHDNRSKQSGDINCLHEVSRFQKVGDQWFYVDGDVESSGQSKVGRNDSCPCGSGKKFKKCCG